MHHLSAATPLLLGLGVALCACSSSGGAAPVATPEAGTDASGVDASTSKSDDAGTAPLADASEPPADGDQPATACTEPPYIAFAVSLSVLDVAGDRQPLSGASVGFSTCPGFLVTTDANGNASTQITQGVPLSPIYTDGVATLPAIGAESPATSPVPIPLQIFAQDVASAIPGFRGDGGDQATIAIALTGSCTNATGVTFAVSGHPEAVVSYAGADWPANPAVTTTPGAGTYVFVNGISGASRVTLTGTQAGCTVSLANLGQTGSFLLVPGSITYGFATLSN